jgi:hypothetical protein
MTATRSRASRSRMTNGGGATGVSDVTPATLPGETVVGGELVDPAPLSAGVRTPKRKTSFAGTGSDTGWDAAVVPAADVAQSAGSWRSIRIGR